MLWPAIKASLHGTMTESEFNLWIKPLECQREDEQVLELLGPDRFFCAWVEDRYLGRMHQHAQDVGMPRRIVVKVAENLAVIPESGRQEQLRLPGTLAAPSRLRSLHPAFTFEQFMVGESNLLARSACRALATGDTTFGNCLFMNSTTGLGKSHLTQAVVHQVLRSAPSTRLQYMTAQQFSADMVKGIRTHSMEQFSKKFIGDCDMLLVEDVHTLTGKNKTQEELNTVLDYLIKSGKRVILTSALAPSKLAGIDEEFRSRMTSGLVTGIESPDYETRAKIIRHKLQTNGLETDEDVVGFMAENLQGDIRKIESAIIGVKAKSCLLQAPLNLAMARDVVFGLIDRAPRLSCESIRDFIGQQFRLSPEELRSRSRKKSVAFPRQVAMYLTRKYTDTSLADIGGIYNRDHSTVLYAIKSITMDMTRQPSIREQIDLLCSKLRS